MLRLEINLREMYDEGSERFINGGTQILELEHSLVSISIWESKWEKSFLSSDDKTDEELLDYVRAMTVNKDVEPNVYKHLGREHVTAIADYINAPMTATTFRNARSRPNRDIITAEIIYFWMINYQIPFECENWHINRLLTLIRVCGEKTQKPKKMNRREMIQKQRELNAKRRQELGTSG